MHSDAASQVAHVDAQAWHSFEASAYLPSEQLLTHEPASRKGVPLRGQVMHAWLPLPEQVAQVGWQSEHTAAELINST